MDYLALIDKYYAGQEELKALLLHHSRQVTEKALEVCDAHPEWQVDRQFVEEAAMLHDIGIVFCNAPGILCKGTEPYIRQRRIAQARARSRAAHRQRTNQSADHCRAVAVAGARLSAGDD